MTRRWGGCTETDAEGAVERRARVCARRAEGGEAAARSRLLVDRVWVSVMLVIRGAVLRL